MFIAYDKHHVPHSFRSAMFYRCRTNSRPPGVRAMFIAGEHSQWMDMALLKECVVLYGPGNKHGTPPGCAQRNFRRRDYSFFACFPP